MNAQKDLPVETINANIKSFLNGERRALDQLVHFYKDNLYGLCVKFTLDYTDADDLFQKTWIKAVKNLRKFKSGSFKAWLFSICANQYKDDYRHSKVKDKYIFDNFTTTFDKDLIMSNSSEVKSAENEYAEIYMKEQVMSIVQSLPKKLKLPIVLHYYNGNKYSEIATILGISVGTVKSRINSAKSKMKVEMEGNSHVKYREAIR
jgi:RNA polymerase sigma-70 factor (ECF subfamily)